MKYIPLYIVLLLNAVFIFAQDSLTITLPVSNLKHSIGFQEIKIPISVGSDSTFTSSLDIKAEYWDSTVYNPYKGILVEYPLELHFEDSLYASPIKRSKVITSRYGWRRGRPHQGIDIDLITGDTVVAMLDGIVRFARYSRGHGNTVVIRHYNGLETTYAHLSEIAVKANDSLNKGQYLGKGGNTGRSSGSHLHLVASYKGEAINPEYIFDFSETNKIRSSNLWVTRQWTRPSYHSSKHFSKLHLLETEEAALAAKAPKRKFYVVQPGDTLYRISRQNNITVNDLCKTNAIRSGTTLRIGQKLIIEP